MSSRKYTQFAAGTVTDPKILLLADPVTGVLEKVTVSQLLVSGPCCPILSRTVAQMVAAIAASSLTPGRYYLLTDFQTVHKILSTTDTNTGTVEPLVVLAIAVNKLAPQAYSTVYPTDIIYYSITDASLIAPVSGSKGVITYREDTIHGLRAHFDWRTVLWRRWETTSGNGYYLRYTDPGGGALHTDSLTFGATQCTSCSLGYDTWNVIIGDGCDDIQIGDNVGIAGAGVTIGSTCFAITIEGECATVATTGSGYVGGIYIGNGSNVIHIGRRSYNIAIGAGCYALHFGTQQSDVWVPDNVTRRRLEKGFSNFEGTVAITGATTISLYGTSNLVVIAGVLFGYPSYCGIINLTSTNATESISVVSALLTSVTFNDIRFVPETGLTVTFVDKSLSGISGKNLDFGGVSLPIDGTKNQYIQLHKNMVDGLGSQTSDFYLSYSNKIVLTP